MIGKNNKNIPDISFEQFEVWENDIKYLDELIEKNEDRINEISYCGNLFYFIFYWFEMNRLINENEKLLDFSESKFKEL